jgi:hypothetical protein
MENLGKKHRNDVGHWWEKIIGLINEIVVR